MQVLLRFPQSKAAVVRETLRQLTFVQAMPVRWNRPEHKTGVPQRKRSKEEFLADLKEAVAELNEIKAGRKQARDAGELLAEL